MSLCLFLRVRLSSAADVDAPNMGRRQLYIAVAPPGTPPQLPMARQKAPARRYVRRLRDRRSVARTWRLLFGSVGATRDDWTACLSRCRSLRGRYDGLDYAFAATGAAVVRRSARPSPGWRYIASSRQGVGPMRYLRESGCLLRVLTQQHLRVKAGAVQLVL